MENIRYFRNEYRAHYTSRIEAHFLIIEDLDTGRSVTNDAALVIQDHVEAGIDVDALCVIYRDSDGEWDGLATRSGRFAGFFALRTKDLAHAKELARARLTPVVGSGRDGS